MTKKKLVIFLLICSFLQATAQDKENLQLLQNVARAHRIKEDADYAKAVQMANQKGWPIYKTGKNGTVLALQRLDNSGNPVYYTSFNNIIAAATTRANQLWPGGTSGLNLSGSSDAVTSKLGTWDGGLILKNHVELIGRVYQKDSAGLTLDDHATHTTGTLIASGVNPIAKGMAFGLKQLIAYTFLKNETSNMTTEASNLLLSNHSYGITGGWLYDGTNWNWNGDTTVSKVESYYCGYYDNSAQMYDSILYHAPNYLTVFAAGNSNGNNANGQGPAVGATYLYNGGNKATRTSAMANNPTYGSVSMGQTAKNIISVGAINGIPNGYSTPNDVQIASFSSWGPTDDGRIKPELVADGVNVTSSISTSTTAYASLSGTSMATPNVTGSLLLLQEYYKQKHPGAFMLASTVKALAIQSADEAGTSSGPDYVYGYGLLDVLKASSIITSSFQNKTDTIIEKTLTNGVPYTLNVIASGNGPLKATIVWTDPPATPISTNLLNNTTPRLVNDLDLRISNGSTTFFPWILDPTNPTTAATKGDDKVNNIEQVQIDSVIPGKSYTITVSNKGTLVRGGTQAFSLIVSSIGGTAACASGATSSTAGAAIDSVVFAGLATKNISNAGYVDSTKLTANIEPSKSIPITISLRTRDASSNARIVRAYIDYNGNGIFESTEQVAQSAIINSGTSKTTATVTTPANLTIGNYLLMRVIVLETSNASDINPCGTYAVGQTEDFRVKVVSPSNDLALANIVSPAAGACSNPAQFITVAIKNVGSNDQTNIPLTAVIKNGSNTTTITGTYPGTITAGSTINYTFQNTFTGVAGTTYTLTAYTGLSTDQNHSNDTLTQSITIAAKPSTPAGTGEICNSTAYVNVTSPNAAANYLWYTSPTGSVVSSGSSATISTITSDSKYYVSSGFKGSAGLLNKTIYSGGGYNNFSGNYVYINASVPVTIDYAKLYIGNPGQLTFIVADLSNVTSSGYNYLTLSSTTIDAYATTPTATPPSGSGANPDVAADSGAYYYLNLSVPAGSHAIIINPNVSVNTTIFRNLNGSATIYPVGPSNVFTITGNSVQDAGSSANYQNYYYFLYDMKISTADCVSDVGTITATTAATPAITQSGNNLVSSVTNATTYQWFLGASAISGANASTYTPTKSGLYTISVTDAIGCTKTSAGYNFVVTAVQNVSAADIGLVVSPNPNNGVFHVGFTINTKANVDVELINDAGQICLSNSYSNFSGQFSQQYSSANLAAGTYVLKVQAGNKVYRSKVVVIK